MMKSATLISAVLLSAAALPPAADSAPAAELTVTFEVAQPAGDIYVGLYSKEASYTANQSEVARAVKVTAGPIRVVFGGLAPGRYAVKAFQDLDGDKQLDVNPFGMPTEPFGFSNNAEPRFGQPPFADAAFELAPGANTQTIRMR